MTLESGAGGVCRAPGRWLLTLSLLLAASAGAIAGGGKAQESFAGSLDVRIHPQEGQRLPPAELLLTDPRNRRVGWDPETGERLLEIPGAYYEQEGVDDDDTGQEAGPRTTVLYVAQPIPGDYRLEVLGRRAGAYDLELRALDRAWNPSGAEVTGVQVAAGAVHRYRIRYSGAEGEKVEIEAVGQSDD